MHNSKPEHVPSIWKDPSSVSGTAVSNTSNHTRGGRQEISKCVQASSLNTEVEVGAIGVQGHARLYDRFEISLDYIRPCPRESGVGEGRKQKRIEGRSLHIVNV